MARDLYPICITGNKLNMWAEREVEEAFLQRFCIKKILRSRQGFKISIKD